jgi:hypothetical protein
VLVDRERVDRAAVAADAHGPDAVEVARDGGLRDLDAALGERGHDLGLAAQLVLLEQRGYEALAVIHGCITIQ